MGLRREIGSRIATMGMSENNTFPPVLMCSEMSFDGFCHCFIRNTGQKDVPNDVVTSPKRERVSKPHSSSPLFAKPRSSLLDLASSKPRRNYGPTELHKVERKTTNHPGNNVLTYLQHQQPTSLFEEDSEHTSN